MSNYLTQIILTIFLALAAWLGLQAKNLYCKYINTEIKQAIVKNAVLFVEQTCKDNRMGLRFPKPSLSP